MWLNPGTSVILFLLLKARAKGSKIISCEYKVFSRCTMHNQLLAISFHNYVYTIRMIVFVNFFLVAA